MYLYATMNLSLTIVTSFVVIDGDDDLVVPIDMGFESPVGSVSDIQRSF